MTTYQLLTSFSNQLLGGGIIFVYVETLKEKNWFYVETCGKNTFVNCNDLYEIEITETAPYSITTINYLNNNEIEKGSEIYDYILSSILRVIKK